MSPDDVLAGLADVLNAVAGVDRADVTPDKAIAQDLGIDSLTMVDVVVSAEDRFGLLIADDDWARFRTVEDAITYILNRSTDITPVS